MFRLKSILVTVIFSILFLQGCTVETEEPELPLSIEQSIEKMRNEAKGFDDFADKLNEQGFVKSHSSSNKVGDKVTFRYSVFRKDNAGYIQIEFAGESKENDELSIEFDTNETDNPRFIHSDGLHSSTGDPLRFRVTSSLEKQWIGIYFEGKKVDHIPNGSIILHYGSESWRSHY